MPVKQIIQYHSQNSYFAGFLQAIITQSQIEASVSQKQNTIELLIDNSDETKREIFNTNLAKYLPHSLFLGEITTIESDEKISKKLFESEDYNIAPCPHCLELLSNPSSDYYLDESLQCNHYSNPAKKDFEDFTIFSPHYTPNCTLLLTNSEKIDELFIVTQEEIKALFSIEKPTIKVTIKDETLKSITGKNYIFLKLPYNNRSVLASINAKESDVDYLFFQETNDLKMVVVQKNKTIIKANRVAKDLENLHKEPLLNRFLNISKEANYGQKAIGVYLNHQKISFLVSNELGVKEVLKFQSFDLAKILTTFQQDTKRGKLLENFQHKYSKTTQVLEQNRSMNLFQTLVVILELDEKIQEESIAFETLCDKSYEFRGNGGLKIDTNFDESGFSYDDLIGSILSFKLAGVENHYLAYSLFEAFADMSITTLNQLKTKFKIENFVMMGDMFENSVLYSRILSKFQLSNPYFSQDIALDE